MGNQQINLLQHMLCSLISSGDIRLRGTRKEEEEEEEEAPFLCGRTTEKNVPFSCVCQTRLHVRKCVCEWGER